MRYVLFPIWRFALVALALLTVTRLGLIAWQFDRIAEAGGAELFAAILLVGLRFDLVLLAYLLLVPTVLAPWFGLGGRLRRLWLPLTVGYCGLLLVVLVFMEAATPAFIVEYDVRPNMLFVEYLRYPQEVFGTLLRNNPLSLLVSGLLVGLSIWLWLRWQRASRPVEHPVNWRRAFWLSPLLLVALLLVGRGSIDHRPANPSDAAITSDALINDLGLNSTYSVAYAIYAQSRDSGDRSPYGYLPQEEMLSDVLADLHLPESKGANAVPTLHHQIPHRHPNRLRNLVIVLEESLGAEFVGSLGGAQLTPNLDQFQGSGIWFDRLYATGTRSVRGIEAVVTGFYPSPAVSVVKRNKAQHNFFTIAGLLRERGYATSFIYGGQSHFDNMGRFFLNNGFERVIDEDDYPNPTFRGTWGVSDEDLFLRADQEFRQYGEQPFFSLVFTSSNHSPFQVPPGRVADHAGEDGRDHAVRYADYALGRFMEQAKASPYWDNTVFLVVADHNSRVYGNELVPVERFHIPGVILGGGIAPTHISTLASQIDLLPTLLSLMGVEADHPAIGRDLMDPAEQAAPGRAVLQFHDRQLYLEGDNGILLQPGRAALPVHVKQGHLEADVTTRPELLHHALALAQWSQWAYAEQQYRLH